MQRDDGETLVERAALSVGFPSQDGSSGTVGTRVGTRRRKWAVYGRLARKSPHRSTGAFSISDNLLRTYADLARNRATRFADLCLTTWLPRRAWKTYSCLTSYATRPGHATR